VTALKRRRFLLLAGALVALPADARATPVQAEAAIRAVIGEARLQAGRVKLDLPLLVENGNTVPMGVSVDGAYPDSERVVSLHVFAEGNPLPNVANFHFGPAAGRPAVQTRIRLATSQTVTAIAVLADGSCWSDSVELLVTLAACLD
jgi:sulfur-oxidizing protein SoxY